jgi:ABC-type polysaccharide/polyol phosphate transport system ATPase subunit
VKLKMKPILEIQEVSKKFSLNHETEPYLSLRNRLTDLLRFGNGKSRKEDFWALRDLTFSVNPGESLGIIGKNGAGKSTLLKILSKITPPTHGKIISRGRIASLLEVGTGFHPELTGRENVYLNGSILGMKKKEINAHFDEIVDFAGTEKFLDTPLKHYSSGMQLRLAFAVAAFLEPEILVIDEVLAVGDAEFQNKCLGKMEEVSKSGRTILFVSHNLSAVENLCSRSILLRNGRLHSVGSSSEVISQYLSNDESHTMDQMGVITLNGEAPTKPIRKIEILCDGRNSNIAYMGCKLEIRVHFRTDQMLEAPVLGVVLKDHQNTPIIGINNKNYVRSLTSQSVSAGYISMIIPYLTLFEDVYHADIYFGNGFRDLEVLRDCFQITVEPMSFTAAGEIPSRKLNKLFIKDIEWNLEAK